MPYIRRAAGAAEDDLAIVRRAYAKQILATAGAIEDPALEEAFASVPRERFLGSPPWLIALPSGAVTVAEPDPVLAYQDVLFALSPERGVNNGSPTLHAQWLHHAELRPGQRVAHIGAGTGYYTALIAHLVGSRGEVIAVEFDGRLAEMARGNLAHLGNVSVVEGDGARWPRDVVDRVYVNFSVECPASNWLDNLAVGGRLVFPLGVPWPIQDRGPVRAARYGAGFCVERRSDDAFAARWLGFAVFVRAESAANDFVGTDAQRKALERAFEGGGVEFVRSLRWREPPDPTRSWFTGSAWSLSYDEPLERHGPAPAHA